MENRSDTDRWNDKFLINTDMVRTIDFNVTPQNGLYVYNELAIKVKNQSGNSFDCVIISRDGDINELSSTTIGELKKLLGASDAPIKHCKFDVIKMAISRKKSVYLYGAAGTGKNVLCKQIADELGLTFYFTNTVTQEFKVSGYGDANGRFVETEFYRAFTKGGLFMLDELDASCPEALVCLNAALANKYFDFPVIGRVEAHPDFRVIAAGNTCGRGASELYSGRTVIDAATLNRFEFIRVDYDRRIEDKIAKGDSELVNFFHDMRRASKKVGLAIVLSYRNLDSFIEFKSELPMTTVMDMCITKGMMSDEVRALYSGLEDKRNKYATELRKLSELLELEEDE